MIWKILFILVWLAGGWWGACLTIGNSTTKGDCLYEGANARCEAACLAYITLVGGLVFGMIQTIRSVYRAEMNIVFIPVWIIPGAFMRGLVRRVRGPRRVLVHVWPFPPCE